MTKRGLLVAIGLFSCVSVAYGANECKIQYGWHTGSALKGTLKNHSKTISLDSSQTKTINKKRMNYVRNQQTRKVKFYLENAPTVALGKDQRNPASGNYGAPVTLVKVQCSGASGPPKMSRGLPPMMKVPPKPSIRGIPKKGSGGALVTPSSTGGTGSAPSSRVVTTQRLILEGLPFSPVTFTPSWLSLTGRRFHDVLINTDDLVFTGQADD